MTTVFPLPSPTLPEFSTLLLKGPYHASAPIHLCLTHLANRTGSRAVLLTPSRDNFVAALRDLNDDWLNECGGYGAVSEILSRAKLLLSISYPSTLVHASLALSMLRDPRPETAPSQLEIPSLCLVVLHEFSSYFIEGDTSGRNNLASYLSLVSHALSTLRFLEQASRFCRPDVCLVVMDSRLDSLSLPVLKPPTHEPTAADLGIGQYDTCYRVAFLMFHYFEWVGTFESNECSGSFTYILRLRETVRGDDEADEVVLKWRRIEGEQRVFNDLPSVVYVHEAIN